jgi:hypothetical protein
VVLGPDGSVVGSGNGAAGAAQAGGAAAEDVHDGGIDEAAVAEAPAGVPPGGPGGRVAGSSEGASSVGYLTLGLLCLFVLVAMGQSGGRGVGIVFVPATAVLLTMAAARRIAHRRADEAWIGRWLVAGVAVKLLASYLRYLTLVDGYEGIGDASGYDRYGVLFASAWHGEGSAPEFPELRRTYFVRWFTGVVYYLVGQDMVVGFMVFGCLAFVGSYLWYRATADAVPGIDKRLYLGLVLFVPSVAYWPASIGKEALMQFGVGVTALGVSFLLRQRLVPALLIGAAGGWLVWVVRPHLLALVVAAAGVAYLVGRTRASGRSTFLGRPVGLLIIAVLVVFSVDQGAKFLGIEEFSLSSIEQELDEQTERSAQGGSQFDNGGNSLNPIHLPARAVTVLLRPFPWETTEGLQLLASFESVALATFILVRFGSLRAAFSQARIKPFLMFCWVLTGLYAATFASFANFGLLVRQRSLVLPALFALLTLRVDRSPPATPARPRSAIAAVHAGPRPPLSALPR